MTTRRHFFCLLVWLLSCVAPAGQARVFQLPTANRSLFEANGAEHFFVGTAGKSWTSGRFGCVRSQGRQLHEGIDIRSVRRGAGGEPADPVLAVADGKVVYVNRAAGLSNFGRYLILRHEIEGLEVYSLYAHLSVIPAAIASGAAVRGGEPIATMGRTVNTAEGISKDRAHVHLELNLLLNNQFAAWYRAASPGARNDHGMWNGQNFVGLDPEEIFLAQARASPRFSLLEYVRQRPELFRAVVRDTSFPWLQRYPRLIRRNARAEKEGIVGFEIAFNFAGVPFELIPRAESELQSKARVVLLSVNESEQRRRPCRRLVQRQAGRWELAPAGRRLIDLLSY